MSRPRKHTTDASLFGIKTSIVEEKKKKQTCVPIFNQDTITVQMLKQSQTNQTNESKIGCFTST